MPEIKNNFTSGKMNKDLDERLLPKNEYRNALNIDIATTEGSDIGSAQNSYGNVKVSNIGITGAKCIGSVLNPENQKIIWFISGTDVDAIAEYDQATQVIKPILVDNTVKTTVKTDGAVSNSTSITIDANTNAKAGYIVEGPGIVGRVLVASVISSTSITLDVPQTIANNVDLKLKLPFLKFTESNLITGANVLDGMLFFTDNNSEPKKIHIERFSAGVDASNPWSVTTKFVDANNIITSNSVLEQNITVVKKYPLNAPELELYRDIAGTGEPSSCVVEVPENTTRRASGNPFSAGSTESVEYYHSAWARTVDGVVNSTTVQFNNEDSLSGSAFWNNVEVGMTFCEDGGVVTAAHKTSGGNIIGVQSIDNTNHRVILTGVPAGPIADNDVVSFRWALSTYRNDSFWKYIDSSGMKRLKPAGTVSNGNLVGSDGAFVLDDKGKKIRTQKIVFSPRPNFLEGDVVLLTTANTTTSSNAQDQVKIRIKLLNEDIYNEPVHSNSYRKVFNFKILSIDEDILQMQDDELLNWGAIRESSTSIFEDKFPRFAYRWKYVDGEYSCISAFSEIAFLPTSEGYRFDAALATNVNIQNTVSKVVLKNFDEKPLDVVGLDILIKYSDSTSVYKYKSLKSSDLENLDKFELSSDQIHAMLPSNQLLRPYDNVPKLAKSQEITANRLLYGNYTNQYDIIEEPNFELTMESHEMSPTLGINSTNNAAQKSVKSLRTYQLGVTLLDRYGRQTPVYSQTLNSVITPSQEESFTANEFFVNNDFLYPSWATHIKYYIKEPKGEYYNVTLDRVYEGETEEFVWCSFPSSDANKIEEGDEIILKKQHDSMDDMLGDGIGIPKPFSYTVISKKNEAPLVIKTRKNLIGRLTKQSFGTSDDTTTGYPLKGGIIVRVRGDEGVYDDVALSKMGDATSEDRYIRIGSFSNNTVSKFYEIESIVKVDSDADEDFTESIDYFEILLKKPFDNDINFINGTGAPGNLEYFELFEQESKDYDEEFQGRFFVKILKDEHLTKFVTSVMGSDGSGFGIKSTQKMFWIQNVFISSDSHDETGKVGNAADSNALGYMDADFLQQKAHEHYPYLGNRNYGVSGKIDGSIADGVSANTASVGDWGFNAFPEMFINQINVPSQSSLTSSDDITFDSLMGAVANNESSSATQAYSTRMHYLYSNQKFNNSVLHRGGIETIGTNSFSGATNLSIHRHSPSWAGNWQDNYFIRFYTRLGLEYWSNLYKKNGDPTDPDIVDGVMRNGYTYNGDASLNFTDGDGHSVGDQRWGIDQAFSFVQVFNGPSSNNEIKATNPNWHKNRHAGSGFRVGQKHVTFRLWNMGHALNGLGGSFSSTGPHRQHITENYTLFQELKKIGTKFRWTEDPTGTIYTVEKASLIEVKNHTSYPAPGGNKNKRHNMGARFHLVLDKDVVWSPCQRYYDPATQTNIGPVVNEHKIVPFDGSVASAVLTNTCEIQILEPVSTKQTFNSFSPAVFEVQPKESSDLNLYFETPQCSLILKTGMFVETSVVDPNGTVITGVFDAGSTIVVIDSVNMDPGFYIAGSTPFAEQNKHVDAGSTVTVFTKDDNGNTEFKQKLYIRDSVSAPGTSEDSDDDGGNTTGTVRNNFYYKIPLNWFNCFSYGNGVESNRIKDSFNKPTIDNGPRVSTTFMGQYEEETKPSGIIFSGIYNGASSVNNLNQFIMAEGITKDLNPSYGSIQKLFTRNTNVIAFCENKTLKILANKDALFNADGKTNVTSTNKVLGQTVPFAGEFGISKNPESFASYGYRVYYTDKNRNAVMRLSNDGITNISDKGMSTFFKENLSNSENIIGSYNEDKDTYNLTFNGKTVSFSESVKGWTSLKSFLPENGFSVSGDYYTIYLGELYQHNQNLLRNFFYGTQYDSSIKLIFNDEPSLIKNFNTLNYEGTTSRVYSNDDDDVTLETNGWYADSIETSEQSGQVIEFKEKEGKWFNNIIGLQTTDLNVDTSEFTMQGLGIIPTSGVSVGDGTHVTRYTHTVFAYAPESPDPTVTLVGGVFGRSGNNPYSTSESGNPAAIGQTHVNSGVTINSSIKLTGTSVSGLRYIRNICEDLIAGETYTITADVTVSANNSNKTLGFGGGGIPLTGARISSTGVISYTWTSTGSNVWFFKGKNVACVVDNISIVVTPQDQPRSPKFRINTSSNDATVSTFKTSVTNTADTTINNDAYNGGNDTVVFYVHPLIVNGTKWAVRASGVAVSESSDPLNFLRNFNNNKTDGYLNNGSWTSSTAYQNTHLNVVKVEINIVGTMPSWNINSILKFVVTPTLTQS